MAPRSNRGPRGEHWGQGPWGSIGSSGASLEKSPKGHTDMEFGRVCVMSAADLELHMNCIGGERNPRGGWTGLALTVVGVWELSEAAAKGGR